MLSLGLNIITPYSGSLGISQICGQICQGSQKGRIMDVRLYTNLKNSLLIRFCFMKKRHLEKESDGGESILFREKFSDWGDFARPVSYAGSSSSALKYVYTHTLSRSFKHTLIFSI